MLNQLSLCMAVAIAGAAIGQELQPMTPIEQRLVGFVQMLDNDSWEVREKSTRMIGDPDERFELDMLAGVLQQEGLSPETRIRVRLAARVLFGKTTKAGLGVGFGSVRDGGVEIGTVVADVDRFPAAGMLMPMDLIVGAEGKFLTTSEELRSMILSHEPGEMLNLLIQRGEKLLDLDLPLGSYKLLTGAAPISAQLADRALDIRWARRGFVFPESGLIGSGIRIEDWIQAGYPEEHGLAEVSNAGRSTRVVSAGSAREVYVGVGTVHRRRIEPWSSHSNALDAMIQQRRIELSGELRTVKLQIRLMSENINLLQELRKELLQDQTKINRDKWGLEDKIKVATERLRNAQQKLDELNAEFESLASSP